MAAALPSVRRVSIRVALLATGVVAAAYLAVCVGVIAIVQRNLTDQIDQRITASFVRLDDDHGHDDQSYQAPPPERFGGAPVVVWAVDSGGQVHTDSTNPALPAEYTGVRGPVTATINGVDLRLAGQAVGDDWVVIGQSLRLSADPPERDRRGAVIAPFLLGAVFLGALWIGRRVAAPIEASRRRQLDFTADASHELRTPLAVIEAQTSLALAGQRDVAWSRAAFERVDDEAKRMRRMLEDLLWLARFDASKRPVDVEPVDLAVMAGQAVDRFGPVAETRRLTIEVHAPPDGAVVAAPPEWLDRLLGVLLDNACKYAPDGGRVDVTVAIDGSRVALTVDYRGPGIPEAQRTRIFDRFHRATDEGGGAGLEPRDRRRDRRATGGRWRVASSPSGAPGWRQLDARPRLTAISSDRRFGWQPVPDEPRDPAAGHPPLRCARPARVDHDRGGDRRRRRHDRLRGAGRDHVLRHRERRGRAVRPGRPDRPQRPDRRRDHRAGWPEHERRQRQPAVRRAWRPRRAPAALSHDRVRCGGVRSSRPPRKRRPPDWWTALPYLG